MPYDAARNLLLMALARELSEKGVHVVHTIANGGCEDKDGENQRIGKKMTLLSTRRSSNFLILNYRVHLVL